MPHQPLLPVNTPPRSVEYEPREGDGDMWTVEKWPDIMDAFGLEHGDLVDWHTDLSGTGRPWLVIRRIFAVKAMFGEFVEDEDMEDWDWKKLSSALSVPEPALRDDLARAVEFWKKNRTARRIGQVVKPLDSSVSPLRETMADEAITELLTEYRFNHLKGEDREFVARRITELRTLFTDKNRREPARQLVVMELHLNDSEKTRSALKVRLDKLHNREDLSPAESKELREIQQAMENQEKGHTLLQKNYLAAAAELGAEEIEQGDLRKSALGTAGYFVDALRDYYADGSRALIDGVFDKFELLWLTTSIPMRPAQYRLDIVAAVNEAMIPYNLFDPEYRPSSFANRGKTHRDVCRRMLNLAKGLVEEDETPSVPEIDSVPSDSDNPEDEIETDDPAPEAPPAQDFTPPPPAPEPASDGSDFMAM